MWKEHACSPFSRSMKPWEKKVVGYVRSHVSTRRYTKDRIVSDFCKAWTHVVNQNVFIKKLTEENAKLSAKLIKDHEEVIELHREIKTIREQEIEGLKTVVETAV